MESSLEDLIPKTVYKYRDFNDDLHKRIITHQEIYFARPSQFPDPYDCRYKIDRDFIKDERNRRVYYAKQIGNKNILHPKINELIKNNIITDEKIAFQEIETQKEIDRFTGVFSVSRNYRNSHLWELFGANNKGFCIGLNFQGVLPLNEGTKGKVTYKNKEYLPKSKVLNHDNEIDMIYEVFDSILTLPDDFIDEQEYRMQKTIFNDCDRYIKLDKEFIEIIILGYKMSKTNRNTIVELVAEHLPHIKITRLKYNKGNIIEIDVK